MVSQSRMILPGLESEMVEDCLVYITQMGLGGSSNLHADSLSFTFTWCDLKELFLDFISHSFYPLNSRSPVMNLTQCLVVAPWTGAHSYDSPLS